MGRIPQERINSAMTLNIIAGCGGQMWIAVASPQPLFNVFFVNHLGATATQLGIFVGIAQLAAVFQLASIVIYRAVSRRKLIFIPLHILHRLFGFVLAGVAFYTAAHGSSAAAIRVVFIGFGASWTLMNMSASGWWSWIADLFPDRVRATFFGRRSAVINLVYVVWFFTATLLLDVLSPDNIFIIYGVIFLVASVTGVADILIHLAIPEPRVAAPNRLTWSTLLEPLRDRNFVGFSLAIGLAIFSINVFSPFSAPFITSQVIHAPNTWLGIMFVMSQLAWVGVIGPWGIVMDRFGRKPVVILGALSSLSWIGYFFLTRGNYAYILPVIAITGGLLAPCFWEGVNQMMLTLTPVTNRISYVSWYTVIVGVVSAGGAYLGGRLDDLLAPIDIPFIGPLHLHSIHLVLVVSLVLVGISVLVLTRVKEGSERPVSFVVGRLARPGVVRTFVNLHVIGSTSHSSKVARALRSIEGSESDIAVEEVVSRLDDPDGEVRIEATRALGRIGAPEVVEVLIERLGDPTSTIRVEAARALGRIGDPRAIPALLRGLDEPSEEVAGACLEALGVIGGSASASALLSFFKRSSSARLFASSAEAASRLGLIEAAWEIISRMHETENPVLRRQLAIATANLMGRPGEFYRYITGNSRQRQLHIDRLFQQTIAALEESPQVQGPLVATVTRQLRTLRRLVTHEQYEIGFAVLLKAAELLISGLLASGAARGEGRPPHAALDASVVDHAALDAAPLPESGADEPGGASAAPAAVGDLLFDEAFRMNQRMGVWWWFLRSASEHADRSRAEFLSIDILIAVYALASWLREFNKIDDSIE